MTLNGCQAQQAQKLNRTGGEPSTQNFYIIVDSPGVLPSSPGRRRAEPLEPKPVPDPGTRGPTEVGNHPWAAGVAGGPFGGHR
jgi:hypothetical protein